MARSNLDSARKHALLGVTWVIISMKILNGLAISVYMGLDWRNRIGAHYLVYSNIAIAQYHDKDAIATEASLYHRIGSAAGGPYGEEK